MNNARLLRTMNCSYGKTFTKKYLALVQAIQLFSAENNNNSFDKCYQTVLRNLDIKEEKQSE